MCGTPSCAVGRSTGRPADCGLLPEASHGYYLRLAGDGGGLAPGRHIPDVGYHSCCGLDTSAVAKDSDFVFFFSESFVSYLGSAERKGVQLPLAWMRPTVTQLQLGSVEVHINNWFYVQVLLVLANTQVMHGFCWVGRVPPCTLPDPAMILQVVAWLWKAALVETYIVTYM